MGANSTNITATEHKIRPEERWRAHGHKGGVLWFTGLSGSGKTTLAFELEQRLFERKFQAYVLDGDNIRHGLNRDLGFSPADRAENIRRIGEVAALLADAGLIVVTAFISPYRADRDQARRAAKGAFHEIYLSTSIEVCESRDPKGLYQRARLGEIPDFTGISAPYEAPEAPDMSLDTGHLSVDECLDRLMAFVKGEFRLP